MFIAFLWLSACQQDVLLLLGDPTGVTITPMTASEAENLSLDARPSTTALLIRSVTVPVEPPRPVVTAEAQPEQTVPVATPAANAAPPSFNPISIPEEAPENTGVRWDGVKRKAQGRPPSTIRSKSGAPID